MTDIELLEKAAKAAGMKDWRYIERGFAGGGPLPQELWNPLTDDGDALRLAVKLRLTVKHNDRAAAMAGIARDQDGAPTRDGVGPWFWKEWHRDNADPYAATRRAIVRAAAAMAGAA